MSLASGTRLGPYEVVAKLGEGGMGEVYRARDTKLDRDVAVKILPESFATDPDRLMRFEREAKTLASLNHPNIAAIYGIESGSATQALVMELVEGEDLSQRIAQGAIPIDDALPMVRQIADALEAAHEAGIVHRDLKPANIKVRPDGTVKVLDFGLAKAMDPNAPSGAAEATPYARSNSPTMTSPALTAMGLILGTAAYMSPEQAKGRPVDKRADIWAFGAVLYEMLTGRRAFQGDDVSDLLVAVLSKDVNLGALPANTPPAITTLLRRCLERDPRARLRDIGDARHMLDQAKAEALGGVSAAGEQPASPARRTNTRTIGLAAVAVVSTAIAGWLFATRAVTAPVMHVSLALPAGHALEDGPVISRDGQQVAFVSSDGNARPQLYVRRLDEPESRLIPGTEDASEPFFSPDGRSIAFYGKNALLKVSLSGGAPVQLAESGSHNGGAWLEDGRIVFNRSWNGGLYTVPENGGPATLLAEPKRPKEYAYVWPTALPGGRELIFSRWGDSFTLVRLDLKTLEQTTVADGWRRSAFAGPGYLVFGSGSGVGELWAMPYGGGAKSAGPVTVAEHVDVGDMGGNARFDISNNGTLAYSGVDRRDRALVVVDSFGRSTPAGANPLASSSFRLARDGRRVVVVDGEGNLWVLDLDRGTAAPLVPEVTSGARSSPLWSLDGNRVMFTSNHEGNWDIYSKAASGIGSIEPVLRRPLDQDSLSFAPDGALLFAETQPDTGLDLWILPKSGEPVPWLVTKAQEGAAQFSPDGQLVAYESNASGRTEVYVQTRASGGGLVQVSVSGGNTPRWSPEGDRVFFRQNNAMMMATVNARGALSAGTPQQLFDGGWALKGDLDFEVRADGKSFLMILQGPEAIPTRIDLVLNWFAVLTAKMSGR